MEPPLTPDYYKDLGIGLGATTEEIRRAHNELALKYHPDKQAPDAADDNFKRIREAYECLSDPLQRASYHTGLARSLAQWIEHRAWQQEELRGAIARLRSWDEEQQRKEKQALLDDLCEHLREWKKRKIPNASGEDFFRVMMSLIRRERGG
ncbi:chaperone protein [Colletotrichum asianum]|uniref:Chaperone protein n=1 Tax=Colletotrichum asianum TaxID=702518 RepID=A0A8H3WBJ1_9PEZI|nr:chaperone protein [Colletotrichum asianum]